MMTFTLFSDNCYSLTFPSSQTFCLCSSLLVCVDVCDGAKQHASDQLRQTLTSVRGSNKMARDVQQDCNFWFPGVLYSACSFSKPLPLWRLLSALANSVCPNKEQRQQDDWAFMKISVGVGAAWRGNTHLEHSPLHPAHPIRLHQKGKYLQPQNWGGQIDDVLGSIRPKLVFTHKNIVWDYMQTFGFNNLFYLIL